MNTCGNCSLCCKLVAVAELNKPPGVWCQYFKKGIGCSVWGTSKQPQVCRDWNCMWRVSDWPIEERPDISNTILVAHPKHNLMVMVNNENMEYWQKPNIFRRIVNFLGGIEGKFALWVRKDLVLHMEMNKNA